MISTKSMQTAISVILFVGTLIAAFFVLIGGSIYLMQHGNEPLPSIFFQDQTLHITTQQIWQSAFAWSALSFIQLGLLTLIATQLLRVAFLCWYYLNIRDYYFTLICTFVLAILIYSSFWRSF